MTQHVHTVFDPTCFRCDLSRDEVPPRLEIVRVGDVYTVAGRDFIGWEAAIAYVLEQEGTK